MVIDEDVYKVEGYQDETATHGVQLQDITLLGDGTVEVVIGVMWEPDSDPNNGGEFGSPASYGPVGAMFVNGTKVGETEELSPSSSFYRENTVTVPEASGGDDLRFVFPQQDYDPLIKEATLTGSVAEPFTADNVTAECQLSTQEVGRGNSMTFFATVSNDNGDPASVDVTWSVGEETYTASGETVPANAAVEITAMNTVDLPGGDYSPEVSLDVSEA